MEVKVFSFLHLHQHDRADSC